MRNHPQELHGARVRLRYSVRLAYEATGDASWLLNIHAAHTPAQSVIAESLVLTPSRAVAIDMDAASGNRLARFASGPGRQEVHYEGTVDIAHHYAEPDTLRAEQPTELPVRVLAYLRPSRFAPSDLLAPRAWAQFGSMPRGYAQLAAVRDWVRDEIAFQPGASNSNTTALDTLEAKSGVCRDFAHVMISFARGLGYPARFVTGVDYGADPALGPPDFHAYVEVFVAGRWYLFDPTGISPVNGLIRIGTGRDAADVAFATIFGPVVTGMPTVAFEALEDPSAGVGRPIPTSLAVSTAS